METPCKNCYLRYSSYCIGCQYVKDGLGLSAKEYEDIHQRKDGRIAYCDIFRYGLLEAKDRPQFIKCEKCLPQVRQQA